MTVLDDKTMDCDSVANGTTDREAYPKRWIAVLVQMCTEKKGLSCNSWGIKFSQFPSCIYLC